MYHAPRYDRALLLGEKRNEILTLDEVRRYGLYERVEPASLAALTARFDWSATHVYGLNEPGHNHGLLLGTHGWSPALEPG